MKALMSTITKDKPKYVLEKSIIGTSPGLSFRPFAEQNENQKSLSISYDSSKQDQIQHWTAILDEFLGGKRKKLLFQFN